MRLSGNPLRTCLVVVAATLGGAAPAAADELAQAGRDLAARCRNAVVTLQVVSKLQMGGGGAGSTIEDKHEVPGLVIDAGGLVVTSLRATDPRPPFVEAMESAMGAGGMKMTSEVTGVKLLLPDGRELPARILLRDTDLDLAFARLLDPPPEPLAAVNLADAATPAALDQVLCIERLGMVANRATALSLARVRALVEKPRLFFMLDGTATSGAPVFALDGKVVGLLVERSLPKGAGSASPLAAMRMFGGGRDPQTAAIVLPAATIAEVAKQAASAAEAKADPPAK